MISVTRKVRYIVNSPALNWLSVSKALQKEVNDNFSVHREKAELSYCFVYLYLNPNNVMIS